MRIKRVPRHRILQNSIRIATEGLLDEESDTDVEKDYNFTYTLDSFQAYHASSSRILSPNTLSTISSNELTLATSTSTLPLLTNDNNINEEVMNLSTKDASNRVDEIITDTSAEPEDKLKDSFLYKIMTDPNFLENIQRNKRAKKFVCLYCKEEFATCEELTSHMDAKKNDSNQIACCACKKTFAEKRYLKYHQRCHSERTKFTCDICTRKYTRLDNLTRHNVLHVNPDKFSCTMCNRTFTRKDLLNKHRKSHEKCNLYCVKCGKYFRSLLTLENHEKKWHCQVSNTSINAAFSDSSVSAGNSVRKMENLVSESKVCKSQDLTSGGSLICKTDDIVRETQNLSSDIC
nr:PREDICTED: gastrula zinc finger protein xFG20-1-like [Linepithema humile]